VTYGSNPYAVPVVSEQNVRVHLRGAGAEAVGGGYLWVISDLPGRFGTSVALVDVRHRSLASTIPLGLQTTAIAYGFGSAWIGAYDPETTTASLLRVGSGSARRESVWQEHDGAGPFAIAVGAGSVWVVTSRGSLIRLDPEKPQVVAHIPMSVEQPTVLAVGAGSVWTGNHNDSSVSQIDPHKNKVVRTIPLGSYDSVPCGIAATHRTVLVAIGETSCS
jgi:streptogramin lyase